MKKGKAHLVKMPAERAEALQPPEVRLDVDSERPTEMPGAVDFPYSKSVFLQRLFLQMILVMLVALTLSPLFLNIKLLYSAVILGVICVYIIVSSISPFLTSHTLSQEKLILRQGWYFIATIPIKEIESVETTEEPSKAGVKFSITYRKVYVTGTKFGLVKIRLKEPKRFPLALGKMADEIIIDVLEREKFVELLNGFLMWRDAPILASPIQWS